MKTTKILISICVVLFLTTIKMNAQVTIGSQNAPNASAVLDLQTTNKGLLLPRVALTSVTAAAPLTAHVAGMTVYNTATAGTGTTAVAPGQYYNDGSKWTRIQEYTETVDPTFMVWVNGTDPNSATEFDDVSYYIEDESGKTIVNPSFTNDNSLKAKTSYLYFGTDASNWNYDGTKYVTYKAPASTEWYMSGSTTDAGSNKTSAIMRTGNVGIGTNASGAKLAVANQNGSGVYVSSIFPVTTTGYTYHIGTSTCATQSVATGITNTGYLISMRAQADRRYASDKGTLAELMSIDAPYGHLGTEMSGGITNAAFGVKVRPVTEAGTIINMFDFYASNPLGSGATVTNKYGVYINGVDKMNYFAGKLTIGGSPTSISSGAQITIFGNSATAYTGTVSTTGTTYQIGNSTVADQEIVSGVTNTGYLIGIRAQTSRSKGTGTLAELASVDAPYGHFGTTATGTTTNAYGIKVRPVTDAAGTITNMYDFYAENPLGSGTTVTNRYGVFIRGGSKANYLEGSLKVGGTTTIVATGSRLEVAGSVKVGNSGDTASAGTIRYNSTTNKLQVRTNTAWVDLH